MTADLKSKLALYKDSSGKKPAKSTRAGKDVHDLLEGRVCTNDDGCCFVVENRYPLGYLYGGCRLGEAMDLKLRVMKRLFPGFGEDETGQVLDITKALFLDTETTGLSGGTGTVAFLVGTGFFEEDAFVLRQYFVRDYDEEPAMLRELDACLSRCGCLVTFNGRAFDWNLLQTRFIFNRMKPAVTEPVHADLLYPSRKIWKLKLESCRLASLEENVLSEYRVDDIPGAMIPGIYFKYLDDRDATELVRVMKHNELDILSMIALLVKIHSIADDPLGATDGEYELLGAGRLFEASGELDITVDCLEECVRSGSTPVKSAASHRLSGIYKKSGNYKKAAEYWEDMLASSAAPGISTIIELAKYYEHREKNLGRALELVENAITLSAQLSCSSLWHRELRKRLERLRRKAGRGQQ